MASQSQYQACIWVLERNFHHEPNTRTLEAIMSRAPTAVYPLIRSLRMTWILRPPSTHLAIALGARTYPPQRVCPI